MTHDLKPHAAGVVLRVIAHPGARMNEIGGLHDGALRIAGTAAADKGKANKAIIQLLAKTLGIAKSRVELQTGETSRNKAFLLAGLEDADLKAAFEP